MSIPLTPETLAACYDYLCTLPPASSWNLPHSEDVVFKVSRAKSVYGRFHPTSPPMIEISSNHVGRHDTLLSTMHHEIVHLHQFMTGILKPNGHCKAFQAFADQVCKVHEFDRKLF